MILGDSILVLLTYFLSYLLRFDAAIPQSQFNNYIHSVIWIVPFKLFWFWIFGLYDKMWRYTGISDIANLVKSCVVSSVAIMLVLLVSVRFHGYARSVFVIDLFLTLLFIGGFRVSVRLYFHRRRNLLIRHSFDTKNSTPKRVLIVGAGNAGEKILRELEDDPRLKFKAVGFVDDDPAKSGRKIHDVPVLGPITRVPKLVDALSAEELFIAVPSATGDQMRNIVSICKMSGVSYKTLPRLSDLMSGNVSISDFREVRFEDLLGRSSVQLDTPNIKEYIGGKRILVTGAGGSIGSELCRQLVKFNPRAIIAFDASEPNLYAIQMKFENQIGYKNFIPVLGGIQSEKLVNKVYSGHRPHVVFHAAAYKHVPMLEENPWQAVHNNIRGTQFLLENSIKWKVKRFVLVSTDKAVRPTNVMGASKRVCELLLQSHLKNGTAIMSVRFGNVMGSSGSVIPLFQEQIKRGGPVTVTHPDVTRFFMTIPEACQLILQAAGFGGGGEIFILQMGTPVKIANMARDLIRLTGKEPDRDIKIEYTGLRPGEKLYEELITQGEGIVSTPHKTIMVLDTDGKWNGQGTQEAFRSWLYQNLNELYHLADLHRAEDIKEKLQCLVPEYQAQKHSCVLDTSCLDLSDIKTIPSKAVNKRVEYPVHSGNAVLSAT
jgi:FlaA1/EpsC-like NDP-sugar epimerase